METQDKNLENNIENKESNNKDSSNKELIETIPPTFKGNANYDKRKNFQQNYHKQNHFNHNNQYYYQNNFANQNTMSKIRKGSVKVYNDSSRYGNQNYNKNLNLDNKKNMHSGYKKKRNIDMNHNNDHNNLFMNDNQLNFINPYKEAEDFSHYNKEFKTIGNLNFLKQNWRYKRIPEEENNNDVINGLGLNMFPNQNINNLNYNPLLKLNFNQTMNSFNFGNNQINNKLLLMMNMINNNKQNILKNNIPSPNKVPKGNNKLINSMMNFPNLNLNNNNTNLNNSKINLGNIGNIMMMLNQINNNKFKNIPPSTTEATKNKSPKKTININQNNLYNNLPNQISNSFNSLIQCYYNTLQYQQIILNKMTQLFNSNSNNLSIHSDIQNTVNQLKSMLNNEMSQLSPILPQNQNNSNSKVNINNNNAINTNDLNIANNKANDGNNNLNSNENDKSDKYIQNILSTWPKQKFVKPYSPLLKFEKTQSLKQSNINTLNINTMSYSNLSDINLSQNFFVGREQENTYDNKKIEELLKIGKCLTGVIRINKNQNSHGYITVPGINNDILVKGKNLYQSLNLDEVVVELFDFNQWRALATRKTRKLSHVNEEGLLNNINNLNPNNTFNGDKTKTLEEEEINLKTKEERINYINKNLYDLRPEGRIVKILKSPNKEESQICTIKIEKNKILAIPIDDNIPNILINIRNASKKIIPNLNSTNYKMNMSYYPNELEKDFSEYKKKYFYVKIYSYGSFNGYKGHLGYIVNEIGRAGEIEVETKVILERYKIKYNENFSEDILNEVKKKLEEIKITDEYIKKTKRKDFRNELVFTIDPYTSKDLDDAIHVKVIDEEKKLLEIGVHIADPTTYVEENSLLDKEALNRGTSVYLVQRKIPMLPLILSDDVCSIMPKKDTLSISCIFRIYLTTGTFDESFTPYFCLSVVNSRAKWDYELVQKIIEKKEVKYDDLKKEDGSKPDTEEIFNNLKKSVDILYQLTKLVRKARFDSGSLMIDNDDIYFDLDQNNKPQDFHISIKNESHNLIEELMLISNILCAKFIYKYLEKYSIIRRHPFFNDNKFNEIQRYFSQNKISIDFEDPTEINKLLKKIKKENLNKYLCIQDKLKYFLLRAEYVFADKFTLEELKHSSLNLDLYTHFSSPIRRYPDIIVHRQLKEIFKYLDKEVDNNDFKKFEKYYPKIVSINDRYNSARLISQKSKRLFQILYLKDAPKKLYTALIMDINSKNNNNNKKGLNPNTVNNNFGNTNNNNTNEEEECNLMMFVPELNLEIEWKKSYNEEIILSDYDRAKNELYINYMIDSECKNRYLRTFDALQVELNYIDDVPIDVKCKIDFKTFK